jgi:hypothetical protein
MKQLVLLAVFMLLLCSCAPDAYVARPPQPVASPAPQPEIKFVCQKTNSSQVRTRQQYEDYYGTMITTDSTSLRTPGRNYQWGIKNSSPLSMAYFASYVKPAARYSYFRTTIYIDGNVRAPMIFFVRNNDRNGEVLKSVTVNPGQTQEINVEITGVKKIYIGSELRINHDKADKIILGEPEFYNCKK